MRDDDHSLLAKSLKLTHIDSEDPVVVYDLVPDDLRLVIQPLGRHREHERRAKLWQFFREPTAIIVALP